MDFTYVRTWAGFVYVAFVVDVFAQKIVAWHCADLQADVALVMTPLRMATWQREREGHPVRPGQLIVSLGRRHAIHVHWFTDHLALEEHPPVDRLRRRRLRQRTHGER